MRDRLDPRGSLVLRVTDRSGRLVDERRHRNRIVLSGRQMIAELFSEATSPPGPISHMGVGTDGTPAADDQEDLLAQRDERREISERSVERVDEPTGSGEDVSRVRVNLTAVFDYDQANGDAPLREAASFNADGTMYNRVVFEPVTKTDAFKLTLLWEIVF
jgi:hypothetical protein